MTADRAALDQQLDHLLVANCLSISTGAREQSDLVPVVVEGRGGLPTAIEPRLEHCQLSLPDRRHNLVRCPLAVRQGRRRGGQRGGGRADRRQRRGWQLGGVGAGRGRRHRRLHIHRPHLRITRWRGERLLREADLRLVVRDQRELQDEDDLAVLHGVHDVVVDANDAQRADPNSLKHRAQRGGEHRLHVVPAIRDDDAVAVRLCRLDLEDLHAVGLDPGLAGCLPAMHELNAPLVEHGACAELLEMLPDCLDTSDVLIRRGATQRREAHSVANAHVSSVAQQESNHVGAVVHGRCDQCS
mmetsp:Transcript_9109/g.30159  ORF Transcript_9109/g.30159 Transcript_9109/m.30159 type:complete len:300 (-) Transcript_9109:242-1141(-)